MGIYSISLLIKGRGEREGGREKKGREEIEKTKGERGRTGTEAHVEDNGSNNEKRKVGGIKTYTT